MMTSPRQLPGTVPVPVWLANLAAVGWRVFVSLALALVVLALAVRMGVATASILVAMVIAATFAPFVLRLRDRGWSRTKAAAAVTAGALLVIVLVLLLIAWAFWPYAQPLIQTIQSTIDQTQAALEAISVPPAVAVAVKVAMQVVKDWATQGIAGIAADVSFWVTVGILGFFMTFFFLQDGDKAWVWLMQATSEWQRERIESSGYDALDRVGGFLRGMAIVSGVNAITDFIFMELLGVPLAGPLAVMIFFLGFIPYLGGIVGTLIILGVTAAALGTQTALVLAVLIGIRTFIVGNVATPLIYGKTVKMHPAIVLIVLPAGATLFGVIGLFAAVPFVAAVMAVGGALIAALDAAPGSERISRSSLVPDWLDRVAQWSWRLLIGIGLVGLLVILAEQVPIVVLPVTFALIFASTVAPLYRILRRRGWGKSRAALTVTGGGYLLVTVILAITTVSLLQQSQDITSTASAGATATDVSAGGVLGVLVQVVRQFGTGTLETLVSIASAIGFIFVALVIGGLLMFYGLRDGEEAWQQFLPRLAPWRRERADAAAKGAVGVLGGYMIATGAISAFAAGTQLLIMVILGIPLALPLAMLSFFGGFIPYIGSLITTLAAFMVTVKVGTPQDVAIMGVYTVVINIVQGNFVAPLVYGRAVNLHPGVVLISIPAANALAGVMGMFLVVPFLGIIAATWRIALRVAGDEPAKEADEGEPETGAAGEAPDTGPSIEGTIAAEGSPS